MSLLDAMLLDPHRDKRDIWIAIRSDGNRGSGTENDPYDGSTAERFDGLLRALVVDDVMVHIGPGVFETRGNAAGASDVGWSVRKGWKIAGSGMDVTTLKVVGATGPSGSLYMAIGGKGYDDRADDSEVSDLTVDCNLAGNPGAAIGAVALIGSRVRVRRVRAIHFGTEVSGLECFVIAVGGPHPDFALDNEVQDCVIEDCIAEMPSENNIRETTVLIVSSHHRVSDAIKAFPRGGVIRNNYINCTYRDNEVEIEGITRTVDDDSETVTATVTTARAHGRNTADWVAISGAHVNGVLDTVFYNGTFVITWVSDTEFTYQFSYAQAGSAPPEPRGEMWVDRHPSHLIVVDSLKQKSPGSTTAVLKTRTPHFRKVGSKVNVVYGGLPPDGEKPFYGWFTVVTVVNNKELEYEMAQAPAEEESTGHRFVGVAFQGMTTGGIGSVIEGNRVVHARLGVYHDYFRVRNTIVRNNQFIDVNAGHSENVGVPGPEWDVTGATLTAQLVDGVYVATCTTANAHDLRPGDGVVNRGAQAAYNGIWRVETVASKQFTFKLTTTQQPSNSGASFTPLWQVDRLVIENNLIEVHVGLSDFGPPTGISLSGADRGPEVRIFRQVVIRRNIIRLAEPVHSHSTAILLTSCGSALVCQNVLSLDRLNTILIKFSENVHCFGNRTFDQKLIQGYEEPANRRLGELTTRVRDALVMAI